MTVSHDYNPKVIAEAEIRSALDGVLASVWFDTSPKLSAFLTYIVEVTLRGEAETIKGYTIAVDVLGRDDSFNPEKDAVVRVHASRMRQALEAYYEAEGAADPIVIQVPKGGYVPIFERRGETPAAMDAEDDPAPDIGDLREADPADPAPFMAQPVAAAGTARLGRVARIAACALMLLLATLGGFWLAGFLDERAVRKSTPPINTIAVVPFLDPFGNGGIDRATDLLTVEIVEALQNGRILSIVVAEEPESNGSLALVELARSLNARFVLTGSLIPPKSDDPVPKRLSVSLIDGTSGFSVWNDSYDIESLQWSGDFEETVRAIAFDLLPAYYATAKATLETEPVRTSTALDLVLRSAWVPGTAISSLDWERERIDLAERALEIDPEFGLAHSVLADKLSYLATIDPPSDTPEMRRAAAYHADQALVHAAQNAMAMANVARQRLRLGTRLDAARFMARSAELDPGDAVVSFQAEMLPHTCRSTSAAEKEQAISFHNALDPNNPARWVTAAFIADIFMAEGNFAEAERWAMIANERVQSLEVTFRLAAALVQQGRLDEATALIEHQRARWPNLDLRHYADTVIPRICTDREKLNLMRNVYADLAAAVERAKT